MTRAYALKCPPPRVTENKRPGQRLRDHGARRRENAWRAFQAAWQKPINEMRGTAEEFFHIRRNVLVLNRVQTARLLRVTKDSVLKWEHGVHPVPFYAFLALLLISESVHYKLANEQWKDWHFAERFDADQVLPAKKRKSIAYLIHRRSGACFSSDDLLFIHGQIQKLAQLESEALALRDKVDELVGENTHLREMFRVDGVTAELHGMRAQIDALLGRVNTATVLPLRAVEGKAA